MSSTTLKLKQVARKELIKNWMDKIRLAERKRFSMVWGITYYQEMRFYIIIRGILLFLKKGSNVHFLPVQMVYNIIMMLFYVYIYIYIYIYCYENYRQCNWIYHSIPILVLQFICLYYSLKFVRISPSYFYEFICIYFQASFFDVYWLLFDYCRFKDSKENIIYHNWK